MYSVPEVPVMSSLCSLSRMDHISGRWYVSRTPKAGCVMSSVKYDAKIELYSDINFKILECVHRWSLQLACCISWTPHLRFESLKVFGKSDIKTLPGLPDPRPAKYCTLPSVFLDRHFLDHQIRDWHFMDHQFLGNARERRRIRAQARVIVSLSGVKVCVKACG